MVATIVYISQVIKKRKSLPSIVLPSIILLKLTKRILLSLTKGL